MYAQLLAQMEFGDARERFFQDRRFDFQLMFIISMLVMAAAAAPKIRAGGLDAMRRALENIFGAAPGKCGFLINDAGLHVLPRQDKGKQDSLSASLFSGY